MFSAARCAAVALSGLMLACCAGVHAQYPNRPMQVVIPFGPGGSTDRMGRLTASCLSARYKQPVVAVNKAGANSAIGANAVKTAAPEGYTLLYGASTMVTDLAMGANPDFDIRRDLDPITKILFGVQGVFVHAGLPIQSVADLVAYAKTNPGKLNYGTVGVGSVNHLATEALAMTTGTQLVHVPYAKGTAAFFLALMSGEIQLVLSEVNTGQPALESGRVRLLAMVASQRMPSRPNVPTLLETVPAAAPYVGNLWYGYFAPPHTPKDIIERNYAELRTCVADEDARVQFRKMGYENNQIVVNRPEEFKASILEDVVKISELVKKVSFSLK